MTSKRALIILLRIVFVVTSLQFMRDAFFKWDGYSYYMKFMEFLPDLSLIYIFAVLSGVIFACVLWLGLLTFQKIVPKSFNMSFEHLLTWLIICIFLLFTKKILFKSVALTNLFGLNYFVILMIGAILIASIVWLLRKHNKNIVKGLNARMTPLVWFYVILLTLAVPLSFLKSEAHSDVNERIGYPRKQAMKGSRKKQPNFILLVMDSLTSRDMQVYGYHRLTTPFISEWSKKTIVFNRAYSSSNWTTPAMMSMMSGQRPWTHKIWYRAYFNPVRNYENNLARLLKDHGYDVYGFVQNHYAHPDVLGIQDSFSFKSKPHTYSLPVKSLNGTIRRYFADRPVVADWILKVQPVFNALINQFRQPLKQTLVPPELVYDSFLEYISSREQNNKNLNNPFFAWLHVYPPHTWYLPPKPYMGLFGDAGKFSSDMKQERVTNRAYAAGMQFQIDILRKRYDEFILYSDKQFELFMTRLAETVDMSNTIVILTSDHGESFSHGYQEHDGPHLYEQFVHVPLIIKMPGKAEGDKIDLPVEQIDIAPTILELAGIATPEWMDGRSLMPLFTGGSIEPRPLYSMQLIENQSFGSPIEKGTVAIWDENYKLIYYLENNKTLLFNLQSDPDESNDLSQNKAEITRKLMHLIDVNLSDVNAKIAQSAN